MLICDVFQLIPDHFADMFLLMNLIPDHFGSQTVFSATLTHDAHESSHAEWCCVSVDSRVAGSRALGVWRPACS